MNLDSPTTQLAIWRQGLHLNHLFHFEWEGLEVVDLDCIILAKPGLHVPEFYSLHSSRLAGAREEFCMT